MKRNLFLKIKYEGQKAQRICNYLKHQNPKYTFEPNGTPTGKRDIKIDMKKTVSVANYKILVKLKGKVVEEIISYSPRWDEIHSTLFPEFKNDVTTRRDELQLHTDHLISNPKVKETFKQMYGFDLPERVPTINQRFILYMGDPKFLDANYYVKPPNVDAVSMEHRFDEFCLTRAMKKTHYKGFMTAVDTLFRQRRHTIEGDRVYAKVWNRISRGWMVTPSRAFALRCYVAQLNQDKDASVYYRKYVTLYMKLPEVKSAMHLGFTDVWNPTIPPLSLDKTELNYMLLYLPMLKVTSVTEWKRQTCDICMGTKSIRSIIHDKHYMKPPSTRDQGGRSRVSSLKKDKHAEYKHGTDSGSKKDKRGKGSRSKKYKRKKDKRR